MHLRFKTSSRHPNSYQALIRLPHNHVKHRNPVWKITESAQYTTDQQLKYAWVLKTKLRRTLCRTVNRYKCCSMKVNSLCTGQYVESVMPLAFTHVEICSKLVVLLFILHGVQFFLSSRFVHPFTEKKCVYLTVHLTQQPILDMLPWRLISALKMRHHQITKKQRCIMNVYNTKFSYKALAKFCQSIMKNF